MSSILCWAASSAFFCRLNVLVVVTVWHRMRSCFAKINLQINHESSVSDREGPGQMYARRILEPAARFPSKNLIIIGQNNPLLVAALYFVNALGQNPANTFVRLLDSDCSSLHLSKPLLPKKWQILSLSHDEDFAQFCKAASQQQVMVTKKSENLQFQVRWLGLMLKWFERISNELWMPVGEGPHCSHYVWKIGTRLNESA